MSLGQYATIKIHLVDPASSHMLVSKIKPCMSEFKLIVCCALKEIVGMLAPATNQVIV